jgi:hypothetical protein
LYPTPQSRGARGWLEWMRGRCGRPLRERSGVRTAGSGSACSNRQRRARTAAARSTTRTIVAADTHFVTDQHRQALLDSCVSYVESKSAFTHAILAAQRAGIDDEEIARITGLHVPMIAAVLRTL